jgi:phosphate transport system substrate-binding protein
LFRRLFIYVSNPTLDSKPAVREFVDFYLANSKKCVRGSGYVERTDEAYANKKQKIASKETAYKFKDAKPGQAITKYL